VKASMLVALAGLSISIAHAAEPTGTLMLECQGTATKEDAKTGEQTEPMVVIVNFETRTVQGFGYPSSMEITHADEVSITFGAYDINTRVYVLGRIDRVTGNVWAVWSGQVHIQSSPWGFYSLKCKPT
jgi:hypothetical protein